MNISFGLLLFDNKSSTFITDLRFATKTRKCYKEGQCSSLGLKYIYIYIYGPKGFHLEHLLSFLHFYCPFQRWFLFFFLVIYIFSFFFLFDISTCGFFLCHSKFINELFIQLLFFLLVVLFFFLKFISFSLLFELIIYSFIHFFWLSFFLSFFLHQDFFWSSFNSFCLPVIFSYFFLVWSFFFFF